MAWALVTGAAIRIGREIALELARHGFDIVIHYKSSADEAKQLAEEIQELGRSACLAEIDLAVPKMTEMLIPSLVEELGTINVLVNNASLFEHDEQDPDGSRIWAVNAEAPRILSKAFRDQLPKGERGVIINMLDTSKALSAPKLKGYARSKKFLADITLNMAKSYAPHIRVNGVALMYVLPPQGMSEDSFRKLADGKIVSPEKVAMTVRKLVETPALTGQIVTVA